MNHIEAVKVLREGIILAGDNPNIDQSRKIADDALAATEQLEQDEPIAIVVQKNGGNGLAWLVAANSVDVNTKLHATQQPAPQPATGWISVDDRLPEIKEIPYQVVAICKKEYGAETNYHGQGVKGIYQDWVIRTWTKKYQYWMPLPAAPSKDNP